MNTEEESVVLSVGERYELRNGLVTSPLRLANNGTNYKFEADVDEFPGRALSVMAWLSNGSSLTRNHEHPKDIIKQL